MKMLDEAIDDYFHMLVRSHPWDKKRMEPALTALNEWLDAQMGGAAPLAALEGESIEAFLGTLQGSERGEAHAAIEDLCVWLAAWDWLPANPMLSAEAVA